MKLDLGAGKQSPDGFTPMGNAHGTSIFPLPDSIKDGSVDEIRASHVLEHFAAGEAIDVLKHWVSKLKPGGALKVAVPDLDKIVDVYKSGQDAPIQGWLMGGQTAPDDFHKTIYDQECLAESLRLSGLIDLAPWKSELPDDCAALQISLNIMGRKPAPKQGTDPSLLKIMAIMSVPRLGFMDNFFCAFQALHPAGIPLQKFTGAYWEQCIERGLEDVIAEGGDIALAIDYDTVFQRSDVDQMRQIMAERPEIDALAAIQSARWRAAPLLSMDPPLGTTADRIPPGVFLADDVTRIKQAHFGLTMIRASALKDLPKPWLQSRPDKDGRWGAERVDADIVFWRNWEAAGKSLYSANRVPVGHLELMVLWPREGDFAVIPQLSGDYQKNGKPGGVWK